MITLKRVGVNSAFKVGAMIGLITSFVTGLLFVGLQALFVSAFASLMTTSASAAETFTFDPDSISFMTAFGLAGLCVFFVIYVVFSTIAGGIGGVIWSLAYNLAARWVGGLEVELEEDLGKRKRSADLDDIFE